MSAEPAATPLPAPGWPSRCAVCDQWSGARLCAACVERFARPRPRCARCAIAVPSTVAWCADCQREPPPFDAASAAVDYAYPWADVVAAFKFAPRRLAERGYNQAWELARRVARRVGVRADATLLRRLVETPHVADLPRDARAAAVRGAFALEPRRAGSVRGLRVALVDDVMTTGATLAEAARVLRHAGAAGVRAWVLARTPAPGDA